MISGYTDFEIKGEGLASIVEKYKDVGRVLVGVPKGAGAYEDGTLIAVIAAVNEFGSADGRIPERAPLRIGVQAAEGELSALAEQSIPKINAGEMDVNDLLDQMGFLAVGKIQEKISEGLSPANAESTIKRKGSSTPLVDQGTFKQSITHVISAEDSVDD